MKKMLRIILMGLTLGTAIFVLHTLLRDEILMDAQQQRYPDVFFSSYLDNGSYKFEPDTILPTLRLGQEEVFTMIDTIRAEPIYEPQVQWTQSDYLMVSNALHQFVWKETLDDWDLHDMVLDGECLSIPQFDIFKVSYYRIDGLQEYSAHIIGIYPLAGEGEWGGEDGFPRSIFRKWEYINLEKLITSEEALAIAEENGGELARLSIKNRCRVHMTLGPYPYPSWNVSYSLSGGTSRIFEIDIDAYTGKFTIR